MLDHLKYSSFVAITTALFFAAVAGCSGSQAHRVQLASEPPQGDGPVETSDVSPRTLDAGEPVAENNRGDDADKPQTPETEASVKPRPVTKTSAAPRRDSSGHAVSSPNTPYERGKQEARRDIDRGALQLRTYGYPAACRSVYAKILHREYGVDLITVAGCVVTTELMERVRGYNEIVRQEIADRFGTDALDQAAQQAGCR